MTSVFILLFFLAFANGSEAEVLETLVKSIVEKWQLLSPTIIVQDTIPEICLTLDWVLCLTTDLDINDFTQQLATTHQPRHQDGILFLGVHGHEDLIKKLANQLPSLFTSNIPVFMPTEYATYISLRLDSNIIFYESERPGTYKLVDTFAVKGGHPIFLPMGYWNVQKGVILNASMNRWDRRTDLKRANFYNCLFFQGNTIAGFIKDKRGKVIGSQGYMQDVLLYITEKLNLSVVTVESENCFQNAFNCTCFNPRTEVDVHSTGLPYELAYLVDLPLPALRTHTALLAAKQKGRAPNMWVYVEVFFGFSPWILLLVVLILLGAAWMIKNRLLRKGEIITEMARNKDKKIQKKNHELVATFGLVYIYAIQMGNHPSSPYLTPRILTLTTSILTFLVFTYFASQITSEMTSGPPEIPVRTFEDVIHHDYKVIAHSGYWESLLRNTKPGTPKNIVYNSHLRKVDRTQDETEMAIEIFKEAIRDSKTLIYASTMAMGGGGAPGYRLLEDQMQFVKIDDAQYVSISLGFPKDSEFLQIFNHYLLIQMESGFLWRRYHNFESEQALLRRKDFEMMEPPPLGINNVMFCFILLAHGMFLSAVLGITELIRSKLWRRQDATMRIQTNESAVEQNERKREYQWETREIRFDPESKFNVDNRQDVVVGNYEDQGEEDTMDQVNAPVRHIGKEGAQSRGNIRDMSTDKNNQGTIHKLCLHWRGIKEWLDSTELG